MEEFLEAFQACILNDKLGFTRERCSLLEQAFLACAQVTQYVFVFISVLNCYREAQFSGFHFGISCAIFEAMLQVFSV